MKKIIQSCLVIALFLAGYADTFGQFSLASYVSSNSKVGIGYSFSDRITAEVRLPDLELTENPIGDLVVMYNFKQEQFYDLYIGLGYVEERREGVMVPVGMQFRPIPEFRNISVQMEFSPIYKEDDWFFDNSIAVRYTFGSK